MFDIGGWVAKDSLLPFEVTVINPQAICLAILPINNSLSKTEQKYIEINTLQQKMLLVLGLSPNKIATIIMNYDNYYKKNNNLMNKIFIYYNQIKVILQFGNLDILDLNYLLFKKIDLTVVEHPESLLQNQHNKKRAYQDLLLCKAKLATTL